MRFIFCICILKCWWYYSYDIGTLDRERNLQKDSVRRWQWPRHTVQYQ